MAGNAAAGNADIVYAQTDLSYGFFQTTNVNRIATKKESFKGSGTIAAIFYSGKKRVFSGRYTFLTTAPDQIDSEIANGVGLDLSALHPGVGSDKVYIDEITDTTTGGENPEERTIDFIGSSYPDAAFT